MSNNQKKDSNLTVNDVDPFDLVEADEDGPEPFEEPAPVKKVAPKKTVKPPSDREGVTVTLKGGAGFDSPWIVIHAADLADAYEQVSGDNATVLSKLMDRTKAAAKHFTGGESAPARPAPQAATAPPAGAGEPPGPDWTFKSGIGKTGKPWKAWMPPRGSDEQPVWIR